IGGFGGYKYGNIHSSIHVTEDEGRDARAIEDHAGQALDTSGAELGGLFGYNYQFNHLVLGVEAAGGYLWLRNSRGSEFSTPSDRLPSGYFESTSFKTHYLLTVGPRIGYAFCKWLPYVTGGLAVGDLEFNQRISELDDFNEFRRASDTNVGWFVGGGLQYALTNHWSARAQYQYIDLGSIGFDHFSNFELAGGSSKIFLRENNVSFAIIYGF
ncbi:MAG: outer membrane beta-barrel protein, partial [Verrucomicrobiota bacterium]|nr:outer membrane beta-barrel protein [Verrucomicrobiota bacterium]